MIPNVISLDEAALCVRSRSGNAKIADVLWIENHVGGDKSFDELTAFLEEQPWKANIRELSIAWNSKLTTLKVTKFFPNLRYVLVYGRAIKDLSQLLAVRSLDRLYVDVPKTTGRSLEVLKELKVNVLIARFYDREDVQCLPKGKQLKGLSVLSWPFQTLESLSSLTLEEFHVSKSNLINTAGLNCKNLRKVGLVACRKLIDISTLRAEDLGIYRSNCVDLSSINGSALRKLRFQEQQSLPTFSFLAHCKILEDLTVTGTRVVGRDLQFIASSPSLRLAWLGGMPNKSIEQIGLANQRIRVSNGKICYCYGRKVDVDEFYRES